MDNDTALRLADALDRHTNALEALTFQLETGTLADINYHVEQLFANSERGR